MSPTAPKNEESCGFRNEQTLSHGWSLSSLSRRCSSAMVSSAVKMSFTEPVLCLPWPCGSGPTHPEKPNGSRRSASRYAWMFSSLGVPLSSIESRYPSPPGSGSATWEACHLPLKSVRYPPARNQSPIVGTVDEDSQNMSSSMAAFASPSVCVTPCSDGYWPVRSDARLGAHAAAIA